jgi:histidine triad (HIT) family protein
VSDSCIFCEIIAGVAPAKIVDAWTDAMAFVPLTPVCDGHVLIVSRMHVDDAATNQWTTASVMRRAAAYIQEMGGSWNIITSIGKAATQSVKHLHVHLVPRTEDDNLMVPWGTIYGDDPTAPHWCKVADDLYRLQRCDDLPLTNVITKERT